jgi:hypothetical protein
MIVGGVENFGASTVKRAAAVLAAMGVFSALGGCEGFYAGGDAGAAARRHAQSNSGGRSQASTAAFALSVKSSGLGATVAFQ